MERRLTRQLEVGKVKVGGAAPIAVQSMTNTKTSDPAATLEQINRLAEAGCDIRRKSYPCNRGYSFRLQACPCCN